MAKTKEVVTPQTDNLGNGQVDATNTATTPAVDSTKILIGKMKSIGLDSKGLYTDWSTNPEDAIDTIDFMVKKHKLDDSDKTAILEMFAKMQAANAPKVKTIKPVPDGLAEDLAQAFYNRQQTLALYNAAKKAVDVLWTPAVDASKTELDAACAAVVAAGLFVDRKTGKVKHAKSGTSTTDGTHGNSGSVKLSIGWIDIKINGIEYDSWKSAVQALEPGMIVATSTNYLANTKFANVCAEKNLPIAVTIKLALKDHTAEQALDAWNAVDTDTGKFASGAHRKLAEVGAAITIA